MIKIGDFKILPAGVGGGVDNDGSGVLINEGLHVEQVHLPVLLRQQVVLPGLNT